ncbi:sulfurtransferase-like selenium metabolism protein YedF [Campylobacter sp. 19-13652]|uniref:sulfurtransferase-like selenium metabolism protein YedF n=1 Tax=Campylobacter sp. 19-13652 TaxID=2840180 RepID=UPI001C78132A|nr:sulfurtransferase-like selenium metabolism protein YedF [Campylobacter sp. 19-13652]BCX80171.1 SirA-like protein [Campylobacter sp. 19-13652]
MKIDYILDLKGEPCPFPAMAAIEAYESMKNGQVVQILSDCPQSINSVPEDAKKRGHEVLSIEQSGPTFTYIIKCVK